MLLFFICDCDPVELEGSLFLIQLFGKFDEVLGFRAAAALSSSEVVVAALLDSLLVAGAVFCFQMRDEV